MHKARAAGHAEAKQGSIWFRDLATALQFSPLESHIIAYRVTRLAKAKANTLSVQKVASDIAKAIASLGGSPGKQRTAHGAFPAAKEKGESSTNTDRGQNGRQRS